MVNAFVYKNNIVDLTQKLIRTPSLTGDEEKLAKIVLEELKTNGVECSFIDDIGNVIGILRGVGKGPNLLFTGHLDVVPEGNASAWKGYDPFGGEIDLEGHIHGRGASDLKGGLSIILFLFKLLARSQRKGVVFPGDIIFSAVVHEEAAEMFGMEHLCMTTLPINKVNFDIVYLYEATNLDVYLGHRGKVELIASTEGKIAHSSTPWLGVNALEKMLPVMNTIFDEMSKSCRSHPTLGKGSITITNLSCKPGTLSIIPDECSIYIDRRYLPDESLEDILNEFHRIFSLIATRDPDFKASISPRKVVERSYTGLVKEVKKYHPPWIVKADNLYVGKTLNALRKAGQNPGIGYWKGGTDGSLTGALMGIPTIGYSGMEEKYAHTYDDKVSIEKMLSSLEGYIYIIGELFDIEPETLIK
jgi:putative selenium metabolism hydrolase